MSKCILVMAGGTGGHIFPGIAVAESLKTEGWDVQWLGAVGKMEEQLVPKHGIPLSTIHIAGLRGKGVASLLVAPWRIFKAILAARSVIKRVKPDVVLGMGGFATGPGGVAAWLSGIPLVLHEQNAVPGLTNKLLAKLATRVMTGFDNTFHRQGDAKYVWVGNPIRADFVRSDKLPPNTINVLIVGGSLGARALNEAVPAAFSSLDRSRWAIRHQCGKGNAYQVQARYAESGFSDEQAVVSDFIDNMFDAYQWADLVICRAGALTVSEIAMVGRAAVFVPFPFAVDDHQTRNAASLVNANAAVLLPQPELEQGGLVSLLSDFQVYPEKLQSMAALTANVAKPNATQDVANCCKELAGHAHD